jgi:hypothetical protein
MKSVLILAGIVGMVLASLYWAYVVGLGWGWFVTPATGLPVPPFWVLYGALQTIGTVAYRSSNIADMYTREKMKAEYGKEAANEKEFLYFGIALGGTLAFITFAWFFMWIIRSFTL